MPESPPPTAMELRHERSESARLDNFVDGAFAFAITLLVISGTGLPRNMTALDNALRGVPAFAACFAQLAWFWHAHVRWRDSVGLTDRHSLYLSLLLVFFALIFVFPLHLVYSGLFNGLSHGALSPEVTVFVGSQQGTSALFVCYGLSYACMAGTLAALYRHGARAATRIERHEAVAVRIWALIWGYVAVIGLVSALVAFSLPPSMAGFAGLSYFLLSFIGVVAWRYRKHLEARDSA